jgi:hypothetical protein
MAPRILDPNRFILAAGVTDWSVIGKLRNQDAGVIADRRKIIPQMLQLRWMLDPALGMPTEAFQVWTRPHGGGAAPSAVPNVTQYPTILGWTAYGWDNALVFVAGSVTITGAPAILVAYAGAPYVSAVVGFNVFQVGTVEFSFSGASIQSLVLMGHGSIANLTGFDGTNAANDPAWKPVEIVGLPVQPAQWTGVFGWSKQQGMTGGLVAPVDAALDRYRRGAPFFGWFDPIEAGHPAPPWIAADPKAIVQTMQTDMLGDLHTMMANFAPEKQIDFRVQHALATQGTGQTAATSFSPISTLMLAVVSDPLASLIAGFGTAYPVPREVTGAVAIGAASFDFMVTALYEKGLDGQSAAEEYAAIVCSPGNGPAPPQPANLAVVLEGLATPDVADQRYRAVARMMWDQVQQSTPFRVACYAAARYGVTPALPTVPLMGPRKFDPDTALQPISATTSQVIGDTTGQIRSTDDTFSVDPASAPNVARYAVAHQNLFGVWSLWSAANVAAQELAVQKVRLLSARLDCTVPPSGSACDGTLTLDLSWDWTVRRPRQLQLTGRLYAAAKPGAAPADLSVPTGLATGFPGGAGVPFTLTFNGADAGSLPAGSTLAYVTDDMTAVQASPVVVVGPRRYRITIPGFKLDFATTGHVGLALWGRGQENLAPQRMGDWSSEPLLASASDPRPPVITATHEDVQLASLPDARGEHRARLAWAALPGAVGYFVYEASESKFRIAAALGEAATGRTLSDRLLDLRNAFQASPLREPFTRINSTALTGTDTEVVIPRGSKEIHIYLVIGVSAGNVESAWPSLADPDRRKRFQAYAAPQVISPSPVRLEVRQAEVKTGLTTSFRAGVAITTRPGAQVIRVDLYRVRREEASLELDTMGPPVARITGNDAVWTATPSTGTGPGEAQPMGTIRGNDNPPQSWQRIFYRAVAISADDGPRGLYGGRSQPTGAVSVIVPPDDAPDLSSIGADWPGGQLEAMRFTFTSAAPVPNTALGPHRLRVEAFSLAADGTPRPLFAWPPVPPGGGNPDGRLSVVPTAPAAAPVLWQENVPGGTQFRLLLTRPHVGDALRVRVLLTDPLGRATERTMDSPGVPPLPAPDILTPSLATVAGGRFVLSFVTDVPFAATPVGPYTLTVEARAAPTLLNPRPVPVTATVALPSIRTLRVGEDPFTDPAPIPLRLQTTHINVYLRAAAADLTLTLAAPDGRTAHFSRKVP